MGQETLNYGRLHTLELKNVIKHVVEARICTAISRRTEVLLLPPPTCRGALSEYAALAMPRLAHISGRAA